MSDYIEVQRNGQSRRCLVESLKVSIISCLEMRDQFETGVKPAEVIENELYNDEGEHLLQNKPIVES
jgi:hypothetical protein